MFQLLIRPFSLSHLEKMGLCKGKKEGKVGNKIYVKDGSLLYLIALFFAKIIGVERRCWTSKMRVWSIGGMVALTRENQSTR